MKKPKNMQEYDGYSLPERKEFSVEQLDKMKKIYDERMKEFRIQKTKKSQKDGSNATE